MNYQNISKCINERNLLVLSLIMTAIFLFLNIVGIIRLPSFLNGIILVIFPNKNYFLVLSFVFLILSFINIIKDTNGKIKITVVSSFLKILLKIFTILFWIGFICIPTRYYDFKTYMLQNIILTIGIVFLSVSIYLAQKNTRISYVCSNCGANVNVDQKFCKKCGNRITE